MSQFTNLLKDIQSCQECVRFLEHGVRPVVRIHPDSKILIIGQAPGIRVHKSGIPWDDPSGKRLREWMGITDDVFYDETKHAIVPMGFCYPGKGKTGDLPPRKECAPLWHSKIMEHLPNIQLTLLIGQYAQNYYLKGRKSTLTETVKAWKLYAPQFIPLPHPSPRNIYWLQKNPWFEQEVVTYLKQVVRDILR